MTALAFARAREKGRERKIQKRRNDDDDDDDSQMQRRERYLKQRKPWYFYICLWVCVREDFLCIRKEVPSFRGGKKASLGKQKALLLASVCGSRNGRTERRDEACRRKKVFSPRSRTRQRTRKTKKSRIRRKQTKKRSPRKTAKAPIINF